MKLAQRQTGDFSDTMATLQLVDVPESWSGLWEISQSTFPSDGIWFLQDEYILELQPVLMLPKDAVESLLCTLQTIRNDACLSRLSWHYHRLLFHGSRDLIPWGVYLPSLTPYMGEQSGLFIAVVLFSGYRTTVQNHKDRGISTHVLVETFSDVLLWMNHYRRKFGHWGLEAFWLYYHFSGRLYRLGRLQFVIDTFRGDIRVFRHRQTGRVVAFSEPGIRYRRDGQVDGTGKVYDSEQSFVSTLEVEDDYTRGHVISPQGHTIQNQIELPRGDWELVLEKGDPVLDIHIPEGEKLAHDLCGESIRNAESIFTKHVPEWRFKAFTCATWLFDSQFQRLLPASSNIVKFQREFYLYPIPSDGSSVIGRVFGDNFSDLASAPKDTLLRKAIFEHLSNGGHMRDAGGFILADDGLVWGQEVYQKGEP